MANAILGRKVVMTQLFTEEGNLVPVTVVEAGPCPVVQVKTEDGKDGYRALQLGFSPQKASRLTQPVLGHLKKHGIEPLSELREVEYPEGAQHKSGDVITCEIFKPGDFVDVTGTSKGKGFQGVVKRHHFTTGPKTHGSKNYREPGSTGMHTFPARVMKGKRMPGHLGDARVTTQNVRVERVDATNNLVYLRGPVPGANGGIILLALAKKKKSAGGAK